MNRKEYLEDNAQIEANETSTVWQHPAAKANLHQEDIDARWKKNNNESSGGDKQLAEQRAAADKLKLRGWIFAAVLIPGLYLISEFPPSAGTSDTFLFPFADTVMAIGRQWDRYRWQIGFVVVQAALVAALVIEHRRRVRAVEESRRHLAEVAHLNRCASAIVYSAAIAHELNQPLAAIMSNAEAAELFLKMDPPALEDVKEILNDIRRDDRRASDLIQCMRGLLKKSDIVYQDIDLNAVVREVLAFLAGEAKAREVTLRVKQEQTALMVSADRVQLQQVLINLLLNSMDAMAVTAPSQRVIRVHALLSGAGHAEVAVADSGPGFGANIDHVFESFVTTKAQGMGMGLSISAAIIQAHDGHIFAENGAAAGAVVRFRLPLIKRAAA